MKNLFNIVSQNILNATIYNGLGASVIILVIYWKAIWARYVSGELIAFDINVQQIEYVVFGYLDQGIVDSIFTVIFWTVAAAMILFIAWVVTNTYTSISNMLIIETKYENKPNHHLKIAIKRIVKRVLASVGSIMTIIYAIKIAIPYTVVSIGRHLLSNDLSASSFAYAFAWLVALILIMNLVWLISISAVSYLKTSLD
ncbi:MAG: hypothetical protein ACI9T8_000358 [Candidatus Saccharimonadales bacterium]